LLQSSPVSVEYWKMPPEYFLKRGMGIFKNDFRRLFLFFDFDGTLVPIQNNPADCSLSPRVRDQLEKIALSGSASIAILSGRSLPDIRKRVQIKGIYYGGNHGLEISGPQIRFIHPEAKSFKHTIDRVYQSIAKATKNFQGVFIEKKNLSFTLHYRMAGKENKALVRHIFHKTISEEFAGHAFKVIKGKKVLELAPDVLWDKGRAALFILQRLNMDYLPVYVGDDLTDETAFRALKENGITIRVGRSKKTEAQYYLKGHWEILQFLKTIYDIIQRWAIQ